MKNVKEYYVVILILISVAGTLFLGTRYYKKFRIVTVDTSYYDRQIDSLNNIIELNNKKIQTLDSLNGIQKTKIAGLNWRLESLKTQADKNKKDYEDKLNSLDSLSHNDLTDKFTDTFH